LIFVFRFLIGVGLGGEGGSAFSWIAEARPNSKNRGFWITWPSAVLTLGKLLSILAFFIAASSLSNTAYLDWGWRVPFLVGGVMLAIGLVTRLKIMESPMFQQLQAKRSVLKQPAFQVMKDEGRKIFTLLWLHAYVAAIPALVILPYSVSYLVAMKMPEVFANLSVTVGTAAAFFTILGGAYLSDRIGRLKVLRIGGVITIAVLFPYFWLLNTLNVIWILVAQSLLYGVEDVPLGANTALYAESFATKYRASGAGLCFQLAGLVTGILVAVILPILIATYGVVGSWQPLVWISIVLCASSIGASFFVKETKGVVLE
jgi:MFS family permease